MRLMKTASGSFWERPSPRNSRKPRSIQLLVDSLAHPGSSIVCLSPDEAERTQARTHMDNEFHLLLRAERFSLEHEVCRELVDGIPWRNLAWVRLYFHLNEMELAQGLPPCEQS